jgi:hypothetical protein
VPDGGLVGGFDDARPGFFWCCGQGGCGQPLPQYIADHGLSYDDLRCRR